MGSPQPAPAERTRPGPHEADEADAGETAFFGTGDPIAATVEIASPDLAITAGSVPTGDRAVRLKEARDALAAALVLLDEHSRSPAAASVDLAIHYINGELGR